jgi:hypothetical protein
MSQVEKYMVVAFDMCSSSKLVEGLIATHNLKGFDRLVAGLYRFLQARSKDLGFRIYKFTGDGWILLFPALEVDGRTLIAFLVSLSRKFRSLRKTLVEPHLESLPAFRGLTFGVETGSVHKMFLGNREEFLGRPLILACRLQAAVGQKGRSPSYRALFTRRAYKRHFEGLGDYKFYDVARKLKNIRGGTKYRCKKLNLVPLMSGT